MHDTSLALCWSDHDSIFSMVLDIKQALLCKMAPSLCRQFISLSLFLSPPFYPFSISTMADFVFPSHPQPHNDAEWRLTMPVHSERHSKHLRKATETRPVHNIRNR